MKRILLAVLSLVLVLSFAGCRSKDQVKGDATIQIGEVVYYNTLEAIPVEPIESEIVHPAPSDNKASGNDSITAYAFINKGDSDEMLIGFIDGQWYKFLPKQVTAEESLSDTESAILSIENLFFYDPGENDGNPDQTRKGNETYRLGISELIHESNQVFSCESLRLDLKEVLATDDFTAATWQVTNTSDKILYIQSNEFQVSYNGIEYDLLGGYHWANYAIKPGDTLDARIHGVLWGHCEPGEGHLEIPVKIYELTLDAYEEAMKSGTVDEMYPNEDVLTLVEETVITIPMVMGQSETVSALKNGEPIFQQMDGYMLKITQAKKNAVCAIFALERIYPTENDALADPATGDSFWQYAFPAANGATWIQTSYGTIPDNPVQLEDGTWAWKYFNKVYYMYSSPDEIVVRSQRYSSKTGYDESQNEDFVLSFK